MLGRHFSSLNIKVEATSLVHRRASLPRPTYQWAERASALPSNRSNHSPRTPGPDAVLWSDEARTAVTDSVIRSFLASSTSAFAMTENTERAAPTTRRKSINESSSSKPHEAGLQGKIVAHLLIGEFDETLLGTIPTHTLNWCIKTLGKQGRLDLSEQLFHWMRLRGTANEHTFVKLCEACEAARLPGRAVLTWRNTRRMSPSFPFAERSAAAIMKTFRAVGKLQDALRILKELSIKTSLGKVCVNEYAFNIVIRIAADQGEIDTAMDIYEALCACPTAIPDSRTFSALLSALVGSGRWSRIASIHKLVQESGITPDARLYLQIMTGYAGAGRPEAVEAVLDSMIDHRLRPNRYHWNALLFAYAEAKRYEGCLQVYNRMVKRSGIIPDGYSMVALLHGAAGARGGVTAASFVLGLMQEHDIPLNVEIGTALIACCRHAPPGPERRRSVEFAQNLLSMLCAAGVGPNIRTLNSLMAVQADAQNYASVKETLSVIESMPNVEPNEATWGIALGAFESAGYFDKVEEVEALRETWRTLHGKI